MDKTIKYFEKAGPQKTDEIMMAVKKRAEELNIKHIEAHYHQIYDLRILEIIPKPRLTSGVE